MRFKQYWMYFEQDSGGNDGQDADTGQDSNSDDGQDAAPANFNDWIAGQSDDIKNLVDGEFDAVRSALTTERAERKKLSSQLKTLGAKAEKGSELEKEIETLTSGLEANERRANFYEAAHSAGVKNLKLAYLAATDADLFDRDGDVNFEKLKEQAPELFVQKAATPKGNAGNGQNQGGGQMPSMNTFIRRSTGRQ